MVVSGEGAVAKCRSLMGATNPAEAAPGTIRGDFGLIMDENVIHGSDSPESAEREIGIFFAVSLAVDFFGERLRCADGRRSGAFRVSSVFGASRLRQASGARGSSRLPWKATEACEKRSAARREERRSAMLYRVIDAGELPALVSAFMESYEVVAPVKRGTKLRRSPPSTRFDEIALDYDTTIASPKKYFLPAA